MRVKINLETLSDVKEFVKIATDIPSDVRLTDSHGHSVSAKSFLGVCYSLEFNEIFCESEEDFESHILKFLA